MAKNSDIIFISVKPQYVSLVIKEFKQHLTDKHVIVSIAAGIPLKVLQVRTTERIRAQHPSIIVKYLRNT